MSQTLRTVCPYEKDKCEKGEDGHADATLSVTIPYPVYIPVPKGIYYLQVIYLPAAVLPPPARHKAFVNDNKEVFRSNAVEITVVQ